MKPIFLFRRFSGLKIACTLTVTLLILKLLTSTSKEWDSVTMKEHGGYFNGQLSNYVHTLKSSRQGIQFQLLLRTNEKPPICSNKGQVLMILVTSAPWHSEQRNAIRNTWAKKQDHVAHPWQMLFLIGQPIELGVSPEIFQEQQHFGDILVGNYVDSYRNLTLKVMHGIKWTIENCAPQFILKTDDDCFVNTDYLPRFLVEFNSMKTGLYTGSVFAPGKRSIIRDPRSKWYVPKEDFSEEEYPPYASGIGYILSADVAQCLLTAAEHMPLVPIEDAYMGILAREAGVPVRASGRFVKYNVNWRVCNYRYLLVIHHLDTAALKEAQQNMIKARAACSQTKEITRWE